MEQHAAGAVGGNQDYENPFIEGIEAESLLADRGYDTNVVIPPKSNRKEPRYYDQSKYEFRHIVENTFLELKRGL